MKHYIIGHAKPDLDATVATIALAKFFELKNDPTGTPVLADPVNPETVYIFKKFNQTPPPVITAEDIGSDDQILLVDHNEEDQRLPGINSEQISGIVDHHKANLNLTHPITIDIKPWGSTNTIIYHKFLNHNLTIPIQIAQLMLSAILSDTVGLKSATSTDKDQDAVKTLSQIAGISDVNALTMEIFKAKSNISSLTPEQIVKNDYKIFDFTQKTFIGQLETVEQDEILKTRKADLLKALAKVKQEESVQLAFLAISDVLEVNTKLLILSEAEQAVAQKAFSGSVSDSVLDIGPKLSRKKEIAPPIETALSK